MPSLKPFAKLCIENERSFNKAGLTIEPRVVMTVAGKFNREKVPVLSVLTDGPNDPQDENIYGQFIRYSEKDDRTVVFVLCSEIRRFFNALTIHPEELFIEAETSNETN